MKEYIITADDNLLRRYPISDAPNFVPFWKKDSAGRKIPSSAAFKTKANENGLSVNIASLSTPAKTAVNFAEFGVAEISASVPLGLGFLCKHDPEPDNPAHALIVGDTKDIAKKLSRSVITVYNLNQ